MDVDGFFERYAQALLARDERAMARLYGAPSLILFPGAALAVTDERQTEEFFAGSWAQYDGVDEVGRRVSVLAEAPGSVWADVTWTWAGRPRERFCYQLVDAGDGWRVAVLTPLTL